MIDHSAHHIVEHHVKVHGHSNAQKKQHHAGKSTPHKTSVKSTEKVKAHRHLTAHEKKHSGKKTPIEKHSSKVHKQNYHATAQSNHKRININKFTRTLTHNAHSHSTEKCAKHVRLALESAGAQVKSHPVAAADWGQTLEKIGYKRISPAFDRPQEGDIYIIPRTRSHGYGHIAGYTGKNWVSDFRQNSYAVYGGNATYKYYRLS